MGGETEGILRRISSEVESVGRVLSVLGKFEDSRACTEKMFPCEKKKF